MEESATTARTPFLGALMRTPAYVRVTDRVPGALLAQLVRFALVGVSNTIISLVLFAVAVDIGIWYPAASVGAFVVGAVNSYTLNRIWTFRAGAFSAAGFARYVVVQLVGLATNLAVLVALVEWLSLTRVVAQVIALLGVSATTFTLNRRWAFAAARPVT